MSATTVLNPAEAPAAGADAEHAGAVGLAVRREARRQQHLRLRQAVRRNLPPRALDFVAMISLKHGYLYWNNAKAGCTTVKTLLHKLELRGTSFKVRDPHVEPIRSPHVRYYQLQPRRFYELLAGRELVKFTFVRDPYARVLSCYLDKILGDTPPRRRIVEDPAFKGDPRAVIPFRDFLEVVATQTPAQMDQHWRPQWEHLLEGAIPFDFIGRVERLESDIGRLSQKIGEDLAELYEYKAPHSTGASDRLAEYYGPREIELVNQIYANDFKHFDYPLRG